MELHDDRKQYEWLSNASFEWSRESEYVLQAGGIVACGTSRVSYLPDRERPSAHRDFIALQGQTNEEMLAFVTRHGLLGLSDDGERPIRERLSDLWLACSNMALYAAFAHDDPDMDPRERNKIFNAHAPQHLSIRAAQENGRTILRAAPRSLLMWMWIRLAQEKAGDIELRTCKRPDCGKQFYVGTGMRTQRREYCEDKCRALHHYRENSAASRSKNSKKSKQGKRGSK
jgi:hypothetical protein